MPSVDLAWKRVVPWGLALGALGLYLFSAGPSLVPYRDAGEMTVSTVTLGILHPPGYPLYSVTSHLLSRLPLGNPGYRLNFGSGLAMAAFWALLYLFLAGLTDSNVASFGIVLLGIFSYQFWAHALVAEMYALNMLFVASLLLCLRKGQWYLAALLAGLGLANRADLVLALPALLAFGWHRWRVSGNGPPPSTGLLTVSFLAGMSLYLYLPLRAAQGPWLNWNDPSTLNRFIGTLTRRNYAGTLDLLSTSYAMGENFFSQFRLYVLHLGRDFGFIGLPLALLGLAGVWRRDRPIAAIWGLGFIATGPLFIFLGNLPPNPHAVAIMEAGYLMPDLFFLLFAAYGLTDALRRWPGGFAWLLGGLMIVATGYEAAVGRSQVSQRHNFLALDFARNVYHSLPASSLVIGRSDVPIFTLFFGHWIYPGAADRWPLAQGLMASPWYERMMRRDCPGLQLQGLRTVADWHELGGLNPGFRIAAMSDTDWPEDGRPPFMAKGLLRFLPPAGPRLAWDAPEPEQFFRLYSLRGRYKVDAYRDFFSQELLEEYAKAWAQIGEEALARRDWGRAKSAFQQACRYKEDIPFVAMQTAYVCFVTGDYQGADRYYRAADRFYAMMEGQAQAWKSAGTVRLRIGRDHAAALAQLGVVEERLGQSAAALALYRRALERDPDCADAQYNLAVIYWTRGDWPRVVEALQAMAMSHPEDPRWKPYLPAALARWRRGSPEHL